jgi:dolichyl-phosphate-mannose--protein O-mannosyl transferase
MPDLQKRNFKHEGFLGGKDFLFRNDANAILFRARMAAALLTVLLVILVFAATREMFGTGAAFIALGLLVFDPNLLAHGAVVGTDAGLSCFMFAAIYAFYRYVKVPTPWRLVVVGLATGLALASKHTGILVFPVLLVLAICEVVRGRHAAGNGPAEISKGKGTLRFATALVVVTAIGVAVLWASAIKPALTDGN